jgi:hypothetical protein
MVGLFILVTRSAMSAAFGRQDRCIALTGSFTPRLAEDVRPEFRRIITDLKHGR